VHLRVGETPGHGRARRPTPMISTSTGSFMPVFPSPGAGEIPRRGNDRNCWIHRNLLDAASKRYAGANQRSSFAR
jgi:hypothetical protein